MGPFKAPGPDKLQLVFFHTQWDTIGRTICDLVKSIYADPRIMESIHNTLLVLVPKVDAPRRLKDFRPISLCNVIYKIITKIIANRLKRHMDFLVSPAQCSFVPRRQSFG